VLLAHSKFRERCEGKGFGLVSNKCQMPYDKELATSTLVTELPEVK